MEAIRNDIKFKLRFMNDRPRIWKQGDRLQSISVFELCMQHRVSDVCQKSTVGAPSRVG